MAGVTLSEGFKTHVKYAVSEYDFAIDGGAVGTLVLRADTIPTGAYVGEHKVIIQTPVTSGGAATVALGVAANGDIQAAGTLAATGYDTAGGKAKVVTDTPQGVGAGLRFTVAVAALTAGKFKVITEYFTVSAS